MCLIYLIKKEDHVISTADAEKPFDYEMKLKLTVREKCIGINDYIKFQKGY